MNRIKVIDLLNMISKGEEVPNKIKYKGDTYSYVKNCNNQYYRSNKYDYRNGDLLTSIETSLRYNFINLNDEVEIIEEKKIPKKYTTTSIHDIDNLDDKVALIHVDLICVNDKVNKIIDYLESKEKGE